MTGFTSFLSRDSQPKQHLQPVINEPPPSKARRAEKERQWFTSLSSRDRSVPSKATKPSVTSTNSFSSHTNAVQSQNSGVAKAARSQPPSPHLDQMPLLSRPPSPAQSHKSRLSRRFLSRKTSAASIKSNKTSKSTKKDQDELNSAYDFVVSSNSPPVGAVTHNSVSLGTKLQELSIAHADRLLDDAEYRELKQALFEKFNAGPALLEMSIGLGIGNEENLYKASAGWQSSTTLRPTNRTSNLDVPTIQKRNILTTKRSSLLPAPISSASSKFFKNNKSMSALSLKEDWDSLHEAHAAEQLAASDRDADSILSGTSSRYPRRHASASSAQSTRSSSYGSGFRSFLSPPNEMQPSLARTGTYASSSRASFTSNTSSIYPRSMQSFSRQSYVSHSFEHSNPEADHLAIATSGELEYEIKTLQQESQGVDEQLRHLIDRARKKHARHSPTRQSIQISQYDTSPELSTIQYATLSSSPSSDILLSPIQLHTRSIKNVFTSPKKRAHSVSSNHTLTPPHSPPLSIYSSSFKSSTNFNGTASPPLHVQHVEFDSPEDARTFKEEVTRINARRTKVAEGYANRLEYLQIRLKGAKLRESLPS